MAFAEGHARSSTSAALQPGTEPYIPNWPLTTNCSVFGSPPNSKAWLEGAVLPTDKAQLMAMDLSTLISASSTSAASDAAYKYEYLRRLQMAGELYSQCEAGKKKCEEEVSVCRQRINVQLEELKRLKSLQAVKDKTIADLNLPAAEVTKTRHAELTRARRDAVEEFKNSEAFQQLTKEAEDRASNSPQVYDACLARYKDSKQFEADNNRAIDRGFQLAKEAVAYYNPKLTFESLPDVMSAMKLLSGEGSDTDGEDGENGEAEVVLGIAGDKVEVSAAVPSELGGSAVVLPLPEGPCPEEMVPPPPLEKTAAVIAEATPAVEFTAPGAD